MRLIAWFASNGVAANLLMALIIVGGLFTLPNIRQEVFPEFSSDVISVSVPYLGAAPEEVEDGVCMRVEDAIDGLTGIKRITSRAMEGLGVVNVELLPETDAKRLLDDVKARVDTIDDLPEETEKPLVEVLTLRKQVVDVAVSLDRADSGGDEQEDLRHERTLRRVAERVRNEISKLPGISYVTLANARPYEISIEVSEEALRRHGLSFEQVAAAVRKTSLDLPGGSIKAAGGEILLRTVGQAHRGRDFEKVSVISEADGTRVPLSRVARVIDGFEDTDQLSRFDGKRAALVQVFRVGEESALDISAAVQEYVEQARRRLPEGIKLTTWQDDSQVLRSRIDLLTRNGRTGFVLVFIALALFLRFRLAIWVSFGIPLSFLGAIWLLPAFDISVNLISLFAFIVVLGIVVDDAIVVGENIYTHYQRGKTGLRAAVDGAQEVAVPVCFAVLTTIAAFLPLMVVEGNLGKVMKVIPSIVIATLIFSLLESLLVLPAHLSHLKHRPDRAAAPTAGYWRLGRRLQDGFASLLRLIIEKTYRPALRAALSWRYLTLAIGVCLLLVTAGLVAGGATKFFFFPKVDADNVVAFVTMPRGTPAEITARAVRQLEEAAFEVRRTLDSAAATREKGKSIYQHVLSSVGGQPFRTTQNLHRGESQSFSGAHLGEVNIELAPAEGRNVTSTEVARRWREAVGSVPDALEVSFTSSLFSTGDVINIQLSGSNLEHLRVAADRLKEKLSAYRGVFDITDSFRAGKQEIKLSLKAEAETVGLTLADLARQVRQGFYGEEAQRMQRDRDEVKVMVRYPKHERRSVGSLESMRVRTAAGAEVPFSRVASTEMGRGYETIVRSDRERIVNVTADVDQIVANPNTIVGDLKRTTLPELTAEFPGLSYTLEGEQREQADTMRGILRGFALALFLIYALLAVPFRSYFQPVIVMSAIPFGIVGAVWGHVLMGLDLTIMSMFGIVALTGILVNDSLLMVDFINRALRRGVPLLEAVQQSGTSRFRPILLTSLTTFAGLSPLLLEQSMQARFLIPMAVSLGFGVLIATFVTLLLVPVLYVILEDAGRLVRKALPVEEEATATVQTVSE